MEIHAIVDIRNPVQRRGPLCIIVINRPVFDKYTFHS